ncbi:MAG TPA: TRAP transporter small permease [Vitreimonas sp.]|uniref:TRAP transporter small permease n=1 Tax=Vitreimonas sp. TaxID=3069702 RepID=UPI002D3E4008|nr:TRAP transporter small permease [Vitreimonas sp.]HYD87749.1 TRAP transporter small permease [Vitreimonas sp.]
MSRSNALTGAFSALARLTIAIAAASLCALVLVLAWQVVGRYVLNASPGWTEPVALILMSVAALFGAAIAVRLETHFNFPTLVESAPAPLRAALKTFSRLIALAFGAALAFYGGFLMLDSWSVPMAGAPAPEGLSYVGVCAGGGLIALFAFERLISGDPETGDA